MAVQRGVVKAPNMESPAGNMKNNGFLPLSGGASAAHPSNHGPGGDHRGGSFPLGGSASPVNPPNAKRFDVGQVGMPAQPWPDQPGKGAVPVNPFQTGGSAAKSMPVADDGKAR